MDFFRIACNLSRFPQGNQALFQELHGKEQLYLVLSQIELRQMNTSGRPHCFCGNRWYYGACRLSPMFLKATLSLRTSSVRSFLRPQKCRSQERKGFSTTTPSIFWPAFKSSVTILVAFARHAAATIIASQKESK